MRSGVRLGVDFGTRRIGIARSDSTGSLAVPVCTVPRGDGDLAAIAALVVEEEAIEVFVGLPRTLAGNDGPAALAAREFAAALAAQINVPVRLVDERLSTVSAQRSLHESGRSTRTSRAVIDQAAAVVIVQDALDRERSTGLPAGEEVPHE
jgi:putative Holliday junction resolvase